MKPALRARLIRLLRDLQAEDGPEPALILPSLAIPKEEAGMARRGFKRARIEQPDLGTLGTLFAVFS